MERRTFIKNSCLACLGTTLAAGLLPGCSSAYYAVVAYDAQRLVVKKSEFLQIKKQQQLLRPFLVLKHEKVEFPIALYRISDNEFVALYLQCTHQGCEVRPHTTVLSCPCHGSEFDRKGEVLEGPAERALKQFPVQMDGENIYVNLV